MLCYCIGIDHKKYQPPIIIRHPEDIHTPKGVTITLEVIADGTRPLHYQWYYEYDIIPGTYVQSYHVHANNHLLYR